MELERSTSPVRLLPPPTPAPFPFPGEYVGSPAPFPREYAGSPAPFPGEYPGSPASFQQGQFSYQYAEEFSATPSPLALQLLGKGECH